MRKLKFHEKKLLKKVDFLQWKREHNHRELQVRPLRLVDAACGRLYVYLWPKCGRNAQVIRRYHIQDRDDYKKYNKLCGMITKLSSLLQRLEPTDEERIQVTAELLDKYAITT